MLGVTGPTLSICSLYFILNNAFKLFALSCNIEINCSKVVVFLDKIK